MQMLASNRLTPLSRFLISVPVGKKRTKAQDLACLKLRQQQQQHEEVAAGKAAVA